MGLLLVLNIHGKINSPAPVRQALAELKVERKFSASVVTDDAPTVGVLKLCKNYVSWAPLDQGLLVALLKRRGMVSSTHRLDESALATIGFKRHEDIAEKMMKEQLRLSAIHGVLPFFRLAPPKGGFRVSLRRQSSEKGGLGYNPKLPALVEKMV
jgi:large subunit ribosomal protein L30